MANARLLDLIKRAPTPEREPRAEPRRPRPTGDGAAAPPEPRRHRRWIVGLVVAVVFVTFGGIVWLAYQDGAGAGGDVPLIRADAGPFKVSPDDPGGLEVPNQRLAVNILLGSEPPIEGAEPLGLAPIVAEEARVPPPPDEPPPAETVAAEAQAAPREPPPPPPPPQARPAQATPATQAAAAPPPTVDAGAAVNPRAFRIQLAAVNSEGRARQAQGELWRAYPEVLSGLQPRIERAQIGDALFFRIQAGPFPDRGAANAACDRLKERQAACIVVGG